MPKTPEAECEKRGTIAPDSQLVRVAPSVQCKKEEPHECHYYSRLGHRHRIPGTKKRDREYRCVRWCWGVS